MADATVLTDGLYFGEGPRWHLGRLWFSDFYDHAVKSVDSAGQVKVEHSFEDQTWGLGWLPYGRFLLVSMRYMNLLRWAAVGFFLDDYLSVMSRNL